MFGLFLALPIVLLGAMTPQDTRQQAANSRPEKPNIILIATDFQSPDSLESMPVVRKELGGRGITFSQAFATGAETPDENPAESLSAVGYETDEVYSFTEAEYFIKTAKQPYFLSLHLALQGTRSRENCGNYIPVSDPSVNEADVTDKPAAVRNLPRLSTARLSELEEEKRTDLCNVSSVDAEIGVLLSALGESREDTVVIYTARQGKSYGQHRITGSDCLYDACRKVPLVISYPRLIPSSLRTAKLASVQDITVTLRQLVGLPKGSTSGISLLPLLTNPEVGVRPNVIFTQQSADQDASGQAFAVRTDEFMYSEQIDGEREFYDLEGDPLQLTNQVRDPDYATVIEDLSLELSRVRRP